MVLQRRSAQARLPLGPTAGEGGLSQPPADTLHPRTGPGRGALACCGKEDHSLWSDTRLLPPPPSPARGEHWRPSLGLLCQGWAQFPQPGSNILTPTLSRVAHSRSFNLVWVRKNHGIISWKRPLRSSSPTVSPTPPCLLNRIPKCRVYMFFEPFKEEKQTKKTQQLEKETC